MDSVSQIPLKEAEIPSSVVGFNYLKQSAIHTIENLKCTPVGKALIFLSAPEPNNGNRNGRTPRDNDIKDMIGRVYYLLSQIGMSRTSNVIAFWFLGEYWATQFETSGNLQEINRAIELHSQAVKLTPGGDTDEPAMLSNLGNSYFRRFNQLGDVADVDRAIACQSQAASIAPDSYIDKSRVLNNLGSSHSARFEHFGNAEDAERAIVYQSQALLLIPDGHADEALIVKSLGESHVHRFERLGDLADLDRAITHQSQAVSLVPNGHADKPGILSNLGSSHGIRFERLGNLADIDKAIACQSQALSLVSEYHTSRPGIIGSLGGSYLRRFKQLDDMADLDKAIAYQSQAVSLVPSDHADKPGILSNLGGSYGTRFEHLGDPKDLDRGIACLSQAAALTRDGYLGRPAMLNNLGCLHRNRFQHFGDLAHVDKSIEYISQAVLLLPDSHVDKPSWLSNLGRSYLDRFAHLGGLADVDRAIAYQSLAVSLTPDGDASLPSTLSDLGCSHRNRFERVGDLVDVDKAITCHSRAVSLTPDGHTGKRDWLCNLGSSHRTRFERLNDLADVNKAVEYTSRALKLTPDGHADKPTRLDKLGNSYLGRFGHLGDLKGIHEAIACYSQAVLLAPHDHADKPRMINNLGISHGVRFQHLSELADIEKAIAYQLQALSLTPEDYMGKASRLDNLSNSYLSRFERFADPEDVDNAISYQSQAVSIAPDSHASKARLLWNLGNSHLCRFKHLGDLADVDKAISSFQTAAHSPTGDSLTRFNASRKWAKLSAVHSNLSTISAYQSTMDLIPEVVWVGVTVSRRFQHIHSIGDLATEAAAFAISLHQYGLALEWLEAGRSIVWNQTLQLRSQFEDLSTVDPELARSLQKVALALEHAGSRDSDSDAVYGNESTLEAAAQTHRRLAEEYEVMLGRARQIPGFHNFVRPKKAADLIPAAVSGPIVIVNVHKSRCDCLIIRPKTDEITHVPLPDVSDTKLMELQRQMQGYTSRGMTERRPHITPRRSKDPLERILATLWHDIVKPILTSLGYNEKLPADQLPHITWCTTGALAMLPIHAAGCYDQTDDNLFSYAVSSYAPTLSSLISSKSCSLELGSILAVSQEATLPATKQELAHIKRHAKQLPYRQLENHEATASAVLEAMEQSNSVHFACHALQHLNEPLKSCFQLHDLNLSLADITKRPLKNKGLAFLSACQTATGDARSPDEAIHLAAGMLVAGYPAVIATMWPIVDDDAPTIADQVYGQLVKDRKLNGARVARALHVAVAALRNEVGEKEFVRWVPYIHMGI